MSQASTMTGGTKRIYHAGEKLQRSDKIRGNCHPQRSYWAHPGGFSEAVSTS